MDGTFDLVYNVRVQHACSRSRPLFQQIAGSCAARPVAHFVFLINDESVKMDNENANVYFPCRSGVYRAPNTQSCSIAYDKNLSLYRKHGLQSSAIITARGADAQFLKFAGHRGGWQGPAHA